MSAVASPDPSPMGERELLLQFLHGQRQEVVATTADLTEDQLRWTPGDRLLPIIGVVNHLTHVEWRWIDGRYLRAPFPPREEEFRVPADVSGADLIDAYLERGRRTDELVRAAPNLDVPCLGCEGAGPPAHVILGLDEPVTLRWALLHLLEETAHHTGHADSTRELLDGKKMRP